MTIQHETYDLIIVGGGLVGASLSLALKKTPLKIAMIDARPFTGEDPRLFALTHNSIDFLAELDLWDVLKDKATPIHRVHVSSQGRFGALRLDSKDVGLLALGEVIPAVYIEQLLHEQIEGVSSITSYRPARLMHLEEHEDAVSLTLAIEGQEKKIKAPLVIGADGAHSTVRTLVNIPTDETDYHQSAIVTKTKISGCHKHIAYERFTRRGVVAFLPLSQQECATIWSGESQVMAELMECSEASFIGALQEIMGYRLGRLTSISKRHCFALKKIEAKQMVAGSVMLLGNAAHNIHPIAAQGFNLALFEVKTLVEAIKTQRSFTAKA